MWCLGLGFVLFGFFFFFKQKTAYEMRISDWSADVCSSDPARLVVAARRNDESAVAIHGGAFADAADAGRASARRVSSPSSARPCPTSPIPSGRSPSGTRPPAAGG